MANRTIARLYDSYEDAAVTVRDLEGAGIPHGDISVIANNVDDRILVAPNAGNEAVPGAEVEQTAGAENVAQMSPCIVEEKGKLYLFTNIGPRLRQNIALATADLQDAPRPSGPDRGHPRR